MSFTGVDSLDRSIDKANVRLADIEREFGMHDRRPDRHLRRGRSPVAVLMAGLIPWHRTGRALGHVQLRRKAHGATKVPARQEDWPWAVVIGRPILGSAVSWRSWP